jgi:hypothetical protein
VKFEPIGKGPSNPEAVYQACLVGRPIIAPRLNPSRPYELTEEEEREMKAVMNDFRESDR